MSDLCWLTDEQMAKLSPSFPRFHGKRGGDDKRGLSGIVFINRNGLRWRDAPEAYGPHKRLCSRWKRWSAKGILASMMVGLAAGHRKEKTVVNPSRDITCRYALPGSDASSCSRASSTGGAWQSAMTAVQRSFSQPSLSRQPSSAGHDS